MDEKHDITEAKLLAMGFKQTSNNQYILEVVLQYDGKRELIASSSSKGWFCYYWVNNTTASRSYYLMDEVRALYELLKPKATSHK